MAREWRNMDLECSTCDGIGAVFEEVKCSRCDGNGYTENWWTDRVSTCSRCEGEGKYNEHNGKCPRCKGKGTVNHAYSVEIDDDDD